MKQTNCNRIRSLAFALTLALGSVPITYTYLPMPAAYAEITTIEADGSYIMGDNAAEATDIAQKFALQDAMRRAAEKAGVYVESYSHVKDSMLTENELYTLSSNVLNVSTPTYSYDDMGGQGVKLLCHIEATVDTVDVDKILKMRRENNEQWQAMVQANEAMQSKNAELTQEYQSLQTQYQQASDSEQRELAARLAQTDAKVTAAQYLAEGNRAYHREAYDEAIANYNQAIALYPEYAAAYAARGLCYSMKNDDLAALSDLDTAGRLDETVKNAVSVLVNHGMVNTHLKRLDAAMADFGKAIAKSPSYGPAYYYRANAFKQKNDTASAIKDYNQAIELMQDSPALYRVYYERAVCYGMLNDFHAYLQDLNKTIELNPEYAPAYDMRGYYYCFLGLYQKAQDDARKANALQPGYSDKLVALLHKYGY